MQQGTHLLLDHARQPGALALLMAPFHLIPAQQLGALQLMAGQPPGGLSQHDQVLVIGDVQRLVRHHPERRVHHVHLLLPGGHDAAIPGRLTKQGGDLPQLVNATELGQGHREGHPGHVEEERLKLVAGVQVLPS
ncbi:hypothetical protein D3C79_738960 [compost metagenome]